MGFLILSPTCAAALLLHQLRSMIKVLICFSAVIVWSGYLASVLVQFRPGINKVSRRSYLFQHVRLMLRRIAVCPLH
ncbi:hypothetical protein BJX65DRAFT_270186 [Aspergillus insuetus]